MAIEKDISIHGSRGVRNCVEYIDDSEKNTLFESVDDIKSVLDYSQNEKKTSLEAEEVILTSGILCNPKTASGDFYETADRYRRSHNTGGRLRGSGGTKSAKNRKTGETQVVAKESVEAYHVIQSFPSTDGLDPKLVHEIGKDYAAAAFPGYQCVVSTHMNTDNLHNHIVVCAYKSDGSRKLPMNKKYRYLIRHINDEISLKYDLPILVGNEKRYELTHGIGEKHAINAGKSFKEDIRLLIERALSKDFVTSWADFTLYMKTMGIDMRETPGNVTYIMKYKDKDGNEKTHRCRDSRLGDKYMRISICKERGWSYPNEMQQTNYVRHLYNCYSNNPSKNDSHFLQNGRLHIHVDRYDENGRRRSLIEIAFIFAIKIIRYFWNNHAKKVEYPKNTRNKEAVNWDPEKKITTLLEGLEIARTLNIETPQQLKERMHENGQKISVLGKDITIAEIEYTKTMTDYERLKKESTDPQATDAADRKLHDLSKRYAVMKNTLNVLKHEYSLMSKLSYSLKLAKDPVFVLGPATSLGDYPKKSIVESKPEAGLADRTLDESRESHDHNHKIPRNIGPSLS